MEEINLSGLRKGCNEQPPQWDERGICNVPRRSPVVLCEKMPEDIEGLVKELKSAVEEYERLVSETKTNIEKAEEASYAAEKLRAKAEELRIAAEELRASAEEGRTGSEADRVEAERLRDQAESLRVEAERLRASAEQGRSTAYTEAEAERNGLYQTAEAARNGLYQEAETARGTAYTTAEGLRDDAFEAKEATRDAANEAALNCAETLNALGHKIDKVLGGRQVDVTPTTWTDGYIYNQSQISSNQGYQYSDKISLKKGDSISFVGSGTNFVQALSKWDGSRYFSLLKYSGTGVTTIDYTAEEDCLVVVSTSKGNFGGTIIKTEAGDIANIGNAIDAIQKNTSENSNRLSSLTEDVYSNSETQAEETSRLQGFYYQSYNVVQAASQVAANWFFPYYTAAQDCKLRITVTQNRATIPASCVFIADNVADVVAGYGPTNIISEGVAVGSSLDVTFELKAGQSAFIGIYVLNTYKIYVVDKVSKIPHLEEQVSTLNNKVASLEGENTAERVGNLENAVYDSDFVNLTQASPYFVSSLSNAYVQSANHRIVRNQYTSNYVLYLFRVPAGKYLLKTTSNNSASASAICVAGSIDSFVVDGYLSETILACGTNTEVTRVFDEETLLVLVTNSPNNINWCAYIKQEVKKSKIEGAKEEIDELRGMIIPNLVLTIPDTIYAVVGTELNLWNDAISLSSDRGISSPLNYQVRWLCSKGLVTNRCFRYTPAAADVGNVSCTCYLYDINYNLITSKTFTIKVLAKNALQSSKNIVYFGDSLGQSSANKLHSNITDTNKYTGVVPTMLGTRGSTYHYEAVGGYGWMQYATIGPDAYRAYVTGVTSISVGAVYSDGSHNFEVIEVNIVDGAGNILLLKHYTSSGALIMPSGTLTKVSGGGDSSIPYTGAFKESGNPLWNDTNEELDIQQYKSMVGLQSTDKIDAVSFQFGINDNGLANNLDTLMGYIDALYHCFVDDNPNCKFIIGLTTSAGNDVNGAGANYGASYSWVVYLKNIYKIRQFYLTLQNDANYPNIRIAPIGLEVDRYYGYGFSTRDISQRDTNDEQYHNNYVHPTDSGYGQIGDAYFAAFIGALTE